MNGQVEQSLPSLSDAIDPKTCEGTMGRTVTNFGSAPFPVPEDAEFAAYAVREG